MVFRRVAPRTAVRARILAVSLALSAGLAGPLQAQQTPIASNQSNFQTSANLGLGFEILNGAIVSNSVAPADPAFLIDDNLFTGVTVTDGAIDADSTGGVPATALEVAPGVNVFGGIENDDLISATSTGTDATAYAIRFRTGDTLFAGGIENGASGLIEAVSTGADAAAYGILVEPIDGFAGGIANLGEISARATYNTAPTQIENTDGTYAASLPQGPTAVQAHGIAVRDTDIVGDIDIGGTFLSASANTTQQANFLGNGGADSISATLTSLTQLSALGEGISLSGDLLVGNIANAAQIEGSATAVAQYGNSVTTNLSATAIVQPTIDALAEAPGVEASALGLGVAYGSMGDPLGGNAFGNEGLASGSAFASAGGNADATAASEAVAKIGSELDEFSMRTSGTATGVSIGDPAGGSAVFGDIVNEQLAAIVADVHSAITFSATATSSDGDAAAGIWAKELSALSEAVGLQIDVDSLAGNSLLSPTGDVLNAGQIIARAESLVELSATSTAALTSDATVSERGKSTAQATATAGLIDVGALLGDVVVAADGEYLGSAVASHSAEATATSTSEEADLNPSATATSIAATARATGTGLQASIAVLTGAVLVAGTVHGTAEATSAATSTSGSAAAGGINGAFAYTSDADADATGLALEIGLMTGNVVNTGTDSIAASATSVLSATATSTGGSFAPVTAAAGAKGEESLTTATALAIAGAGPTSALVGSVVNSGRIGSEASTVATATATGSSTLSSQVAANIIADLTSVARGVAIDVAGVGGVTNAIGGTITAKASSRGTAKATSTSTEEGGSGNFALTNGSATTALADGLLVKDTVQALALFDNDGTIAAEATATQDLTAQVSAVDVNNNTEARARLGRSSATAHGVDIQAAAIAGGIDNSGTITAKAVASRLAQATFEGAAGTAVVVAADDPEEGVPVEAESDALRVLADVALLGGVANSGKLLGEASASSVGKATVTGTAATDDISINPSADVFGGRAEADADGLDIDVSEGLLSGGVLNTATGVIQGRATATVQLTAQHSATEEGVITLARTGQSDLGAVEAFAEAYGIDLDGGIAVLQGGVRNDGQVLAAATAGTSATSTAEANGAAKTIALAQFAGSDADGIDISFSEALFGGVENTNGVTALANSTLLATATSTAADGALGASARSVTNFSQAFANGIEISPTGDEPDPSLDGGIANSGSIAVSGKAVLGATTTSTNSDGRAEGSASVTEAVSQSVGIYVTFRTGEGDNEELVGSLLDPVVNETGGLIQARAEANRTANVNTTGTAANINAFTQVLGDTVAAAGGVVLIAEQVDRLENAGRIETLAIATGSVTATATRNTADGESSSSAINSGDGAVNAYTDGLYVQADRLLDGLANGGVILVEARSTSGGTATVAGGDLGSAEARTAGTFATANGARVELSEGSDLDGGFANSGTLSATATGATTTSSSSTAGGPVTDFTSAALAGFTGVEANGAIFGLAQGDFKGGAVNQAGGTIVASATGTVSSTATHDPAEGEASAIAGYRGLDVHAAGMNLDLGLIGQLSGGVRNLGTISASASATVDLHASAASTGSGVLATAAALFEEDPFFTDISLHASVDLIDISVLQGLSEGIANDGTLTGTSTAKMTAKAEDTTQGDSLATVESRTAVVQSEIRGIAFRADFEDGALLSGGVVNSHQILLAASTAVEATATGSNSAVAGGAANVYAVFAGALAHGVDLDLFGGVETQVDQDIVILPIGGTIAGDVTNAQGALIQVAASTTLTQTASTSNLGAEIHAGAGALTEADGFHIETLRLAGNVQNDGTIRATAEGRHSATASAELEVRVNTAQSNPVFESLARGLYLIVEQATGDFANGGAVVVSASEHGSATATTTTETAAVTVAHDATRATAHGLQLKSPAFDGDFANLQAGTLAVSATAESKVSITAAVGNFNTVGQGAALASASGLDLQPDAPSDLLAEKGPVGFVPMAAYDVFQNTAAPGILSGRFDNRGVVTVSATASALTTFDIGSAPHLTDATAAAVAQGMGSSMQTIQGGVGNWGSIAATASANAALSTTGSVADGEASRAALAYGILLVAPQSVEEPVEPFQIAPLGPSPLGQIGDGDGDGVSVENHGFVWATATATATGGSSAEIQGGRGTSYAAALQIGRLRDLADVVPASVYQLPLPPNSDGGDGMVLTGNLLNTGTLYAKATAPTEGPAIADIPSAVGVGLYHSVVEGSLDNSGGAALIVAEATGPEAFAAGIVLVNSIVAGGINTTGLIMATATGEISQQADAINTVKAAGATTINILDGIGANDQLDPDDNPLWNGDNPVGIIGDIRLAADFADTVNWSGGDIQGDIIGSTCGEICVLGIVSGDDVLNVFAGVADAFDYDGLITKLLAINVNTAEHAATPVTLTFRGVVEQTTHLNVNDNGRLIVGRAYDGLFDAGLIQVGEYNHAGGGRVLFEIGDGSTTDEVGYIAADGIVVDSLGALNIAGGQIGIQPTGAFWADSQTYEVIYAASRNGAFAGTYSPTPLLQVAVEYGDYDGAPGAGASGPGDVNDVTDFDADDSDVRLTVTRVPFDEVEGLTPNQKAVAGAIEDVFGPHLEGTAFGDGIAFLFLTDDYEAALSQLHGAEHAQTANLVGQLSGLFSQWLADRRTDAKGGQSAATQSYAWSPDLEQIAASRALGSDADPEQIAEFARGGTRTAGSFSVWFGGGGLWGEADGDPAQDVLGFDQRTWGGMVGIDYQIDEQFLVGLAGLYQTTNAEFDDDSTSDVDSFQIGLYGTWDSGTLYVDGVASIGWSSIDNDRRIVIPSVFDGTAKSDTDAFLLTMGAEVGYAFRFDGGFSVTPLAGLDYRHASIDGYQESGASPYNLAVDDNDVDSLTSSLGFAIGGDFDLGGMKLSPELRAAWQHEFLDSEEDITASFVAAPGSSFTAVGSDFGADAGLVGAGVTLEVSTGVEAFVDYNGRFSGGYAANAVSGGLRLSW